MKQGWEIKKLGEVCDILNGYAFKSEKYTSEGVRVLRITNVQKGYVVDDAPKFYPKDEMANLQQYVLKENDLLMSLTGNVGRVGLLQNEMLPAALNQRVACLRIKNEQLYINYLFHFLNSDKFENDAIFSASGIAQKNMSTEWLKKYTIPVPPREEQERIVEILDREFESIDALKANAEQNLQHAKDLFQASLRQELQPKEGWITMQIGNVCELKQGLAINAKTKYLLVEKSQLPLLRIKDLKDGTREIFVNESECPQGCRAYPEDIIYTRTGTLGLVFTGAYGVMHNNCFKIEIDKEKIDKYYLMYYLQQDSFRNNIIKLASRAAQPDITHKLFKEQIIHFPTIAEQVAIIHKLSDIREHCTALEDNYKKTIALCDDMKQALLRKAFNGEL